jgi:putative lipoic acid-binding regulatory protein
MAPDPNTSLLIVLKASAQGVGYNSLEPISKGLYILVRIAVLVDSIEIFNSLYHSGTQEYFDPL